MRATGLLGALVLLAAPVAFADEGMVIGVEVGAARLHDGDALAGENALGGGLIIGTGGRLSIELQLAQSYARQAHEGEPLDAANTRGSLGANMLGVRYVAGASVLVAGLYLGAGHYRAPILVSATTPGGARYVRGDLLGGWGAVGGACAGLRLFDGAVETTLEVRAAHVWWKEGEAPRVVDTRREEDGTVTITTSEDDFEGLPVTVTGALRLHL